jgi:hypothetical protein
MANAAPCTLNDNMHFDLLFAAIYLLKMPQNPPCQNYGISCF